MQDRHERKCVIMARGNRSNVAELDDVDAPEVDVEATDEEATDEVEEGTEEVKAEKAPKEKARGDLPEGYVTPVGLAKVLSEAKEDGSFYHTARDGSHEVKPQMVYSYVRNAPKDNPFPLVDVEDSIGATRKVVKLDEGLAWWEAKNERASAKKANAAAKAQAKAEKAANKPATEEGVGEVTEAEGEPAVDESVTEAE
jgi:hypothetical protein